MPKDYGPPSKPERDALIRERKRDLPRLAPVPKPPGLVGAVIDEAATKRRSSEAHARESRIFAIDHALNEKKGLAKADHGRAKNVGLAKAQSAKAARQITRERTR